MKDSEIITLIGTVGRCKWRGENTRIHLLTGPIFKNQNGVLVSESRWYDLYINDKVIPNSVTHNIVSGQKIKVMGNKERRLIKDCEGWISNWEQIDVIKMEILQ